MAQLDGGFKFRLAFNLIPSAEKVETADERLREEYARFLEIEQSEDYKEWLALEAEIQSGDFKARLDQLKKIRFEGSEAWKKEQEFHKLKKSKPFRMFFDFLASEDCSFFSKFADAPSWKRFNDLEKIVKNSGFQTQLKAADEKEREKASVQKEEWRQLASSVDIIRFQRLSKSKLLANYLELKDSPRLQDYKKLESYVQSEEFKTIKADLSDRERYKKSDEYRKTERFQTLSSNSAFSKAKVDKKSGRFVELSRWETVFYDDFRLSNLDTGKWNTGYFAVQWSGQPYSLASDPHFFNGARNLNLKGKGLEIITKPERIKGKAWDTQSGFHDKEFEYSSGMIQSGGLFEMKSGRIEAKVKVSGSEDLFHAFWLVGKKMLPHVNVFRVAGNRMFFENIWSRESGGKDIASISFSKFRDRFFLIAFDWTPNELRWSINGKPFLRMTEHIPAEGLHLNFSSGVSVPAKPDSKGGFELAWVRCSQAKS